MSYFETLPSIPLVRPILNIGSIFNIATGAYFKGQYNQNILSGGLHHIVSVEGPPNSFKSAILDFMNLSAANNYPVYTYSKYDTETTGSYIRLKSLCRPFSRLKDIQHGSDELSPEDKKVVITSNIEMPGEVYFENIKQIAKNKNKNDKLLTTPFVTPGGKLLKSLPPFGTSIDSISEFKVTDVEEKIKEENMLGESGNNTYFLRNGLVKKLLMTQLPSITVGSGIYATMSVHVGNEFTMDVRAPKPHKLTYSKRGSKAMGSTKTYEYLVSTIYEIYNAVRLNNAVKDTGVLYPSIESDRLPDCKDLMQVNIVITRNKYGETGIPINIIVSQRDGVLEHLSMFDELKEYDRFGISGNNTSYVLDLVPDITLQRTTVRNIIDENPKIRRALEITYEMMYMRHFWAPLPDGKMCTPAELYKGLKEKGYDWEILLNTRNHWQYVEFEYDYLPELSTMDLLEMRIDTYKPYWQNKDYIKKAKGFQAEVLNKLLA